MAAWGQRQPSKTIETVGQKQLRGPRAQEKMHRTGFVDYGLLALRREETDHGARPNNLKATERSLADAEMVDVMLCLRLSLIGLSTSQEFGRQLGDEGPKLIMGFVPG